MSRMEEKSFKNFANSIISLVKLLVGLKDKFLAQKLYNKTVGLIAGYIGLLNYREGNNSIASHNIKANDLKNIVDGLLDFLELLEYSKYVSPTPLLYARKNLLNFKLDLVRKFYHKPIQTVFKQNENKPTPVTFRKTLQKNHKGNSNKERIFNFIKHSPNSRTKEIVEEFSALSERTVKRNLKELIQEGLVSKEAKNNAVYYS